MPCEYRLTVGEARRQLSPPRNSLQFYDGKPIIYRKLSGETFISTFRRSVF
jgi:hypothetical protein